MQYRPENHVLYFPHSVGRKAVSAACLRTTPFAKLLIWAPPMLSNSCLDKTRWKICEERACCRVISPSSPVSLLDVAIEPLFFIFVALGPPMLSDYCRLPPSPSPRHSTASSPPSLPPVIAAIGPQHHRCQALCYRSQPSPLSAASQRRRCLLICRLLTLSKRDNSATRRGRPPPDQEYSTSRSRVRRFVEKTVWPSTGPFISDYQFRGRDLPLVSCFACLKRLIRLDIPMRYRVRLPSRT